MLGTEPPPRLAANRRETPTPSSDAEPSRPAKRLRQTRRSVRVIDRLSGGVITIGGIAVIAAVLGIFVYLVHVVRPLFGGASIASRGAVRLVHAPAANDVLWVTIDEYRVVGQYLLRSGERVTFAARSGEEIERERVFDEGTLAAAAHVEASGLIALAFGDGSLRIGRAEFSTRFLEPGERELAPGSTIVDGGGVLERTANGELRHVAAAFSLEPPVRLNEAEEPPTLLDVRSDGDTTRVAALHADHIVILELERSENLFTGEATLETTSTTIPVPSAGGDRRDPLAILVTTEGDQLYLAWRDGSVARWDLRDPNEPRLVESTDLVFGPDSKLSDLLFMNGEQSLLALETGGVARAWFRATGAGDTGDGMALVEARQFEVGASPIVSAGTSTRDKTFVVGDADGQVALLHLTSGQRLASARLEPPVSALEVLLTPKGDGLAAFGADGTLRRWHVSNPHPETTWRILFGRVWYEGYDEPTFTWQSSSGTDDFEPKLSLVPLLFGTLKATLFSLLFAVPVALLAALATSEFLPATWRGPVKSTIEVMASLPSVVLGFIAALALAPRIEDSVLSALLTLMILPPIFLAVGHVWQLLPSHSRIRWGRTAMLPIVVLAAFAAYDVARRTVGPLEGFLFEGDFKAWLDGRVGGPAGGIAFLTWPLAFVVLLALDQIWLAATVRRFLASGPGRGAALVEVGRLFLLIAGATAVAGLTGIVAQTFGFDPRGTLVGTYVQRNALVVALVMGFAVIPIIYTIAEDALSAVPRALRSASIGCGATRWQTATRIVLPIAIPGIFSALMVGLGRAVGETMIVLMAAGNTPILDLNPFNGLRTLSANIAVELPEAVREGTLYRVLFLAALTLFVLTFVVNTAAEVVRQRFRKRAREL